MKIVRKRLLDQLAGITEMEKKFPEMTLEIDRDQLILEKLESIEKLLTLLVNSQLEETKQVVEVGDNKFHMKTRVFSSKELILALERKVNNAVKQPQSAEDIRL